MVTACHTVAVDTLSARARAALDTLGRNGSVELKQGLGKSLLFLLGALAFTLVGLALMAVAWSEAVTARDLVSTRSFWAGLASVAFFGVIGIPVLLLQTVRRGSVTLTRDSLREQRAGATAVELRWDDILAIFAAPIGSPTHRLACCRLTPQAYAQYAASRNGIETRLLGANEGLIGKSTVALANATSLKGDDLTALLTIAWRTYGNPPAHGGHLAPGPLEPPAY